MGELFRKLGGGGYSDGVSYVTLKVEIANGRIVPLEPEKLPDKADGLLTILSTESGSSTGKASARQRLNPPLIRGDGKRLINPTSEELDASAWGD